VPGSNELTSSFMVHPEAKASHPVANRRPRVTSLRKARKPLIRIESCPKATQRPEAAGIRGLLR
jgi:hypothetical protein